MKIEEHSKVTGFSGNEIFCLNKLGYSAGQLCLGNSVVALGVSRGIGAGLCGVVPGRDSSSDVAREWRLAHRCDDWLRSAI